MAQKELTDYIKQTASQGFSREQITAELAKAGWPESEIKEAFAAPAEAEAPGSDEPGFFAHYKKPLIIIIVILILLPLLVYGGLFVYERFFDQSIQKTEAELKSDEEVASEENINNEPIAPRVLEDEPARERDEQRLKDIAALQTALKSYFETNQKYPQILSELTSGGLVESLPRDPKSETGYVYTWSEAAPNFYSLAFVLETDIGAMGTGLQIASPDKQISAEALIEEDALVEGRATSTNLNELYITDLSRVPFYSGEEVLVEVDAPGAAELQKVFLTVGSLKLTDQTKPFQFSFSAPSSPGQFQVNVFAFDENENSYFQSTVLTVSP